MFRWCVQARTELHVILLLGLMLPEQNRIDTISRQRLLVLTELTQFLILSVMIFTFLQ